MVYVNVRHTVADYDKWRSFFDADDARRRSAGATGTIQIFCDAEDANVVTAIMEWNNAENATKFMNDPALREVMQKAGVIGMPAVRTIMSRA